MKLGFYRNQKISYVLLDLVIKEPINNIFIWIFNCITY